MILPISLGTTAAGPSSTENRKIWQEHGVTEARNLHGNQTSAVVNRYCFYSQGFSTVVSLSTWKGFTQKISAKKQNKTKKKSHSSLHVILLSNLRLYSCCFSTSSFKLKNEQCNPKFQIKAKLLMLVKLQQDFLMQITNISHVLATIAPFTKCLEKCISVHINNQGFMMYTRDLSAFIVSLIKFSLARTERAAVTALFCKSMFAHDAALSRNLLYPGRFGNICEW